MRTVRDLLEVAVRQLNVREDPPESNNVRYNTWYYGREVHGKAYPWCMVFVQWCFAQVQVELPARTASCSALMNAAKGAGCWVTRSFQPGDVVIYDFTGKKKQAAHCGIVERDRPRRDRHRGQHRRGERRQRRAGPAQDPARQIHHGGRAARI